MHECPVMRYLAQVYKWSGQTNHDDINGPTIWSHPDHLCCYKWSAQNGLGPPESMPSVG